MRISAIRLRAVSARTARARIWLVPVRQRYTLGGNEDKGASASLSDLKEFSW